jgi:hypothetical protein
MSFARKAADRIARFVVRHAAAGSKEWGEALASELVHVENDWRALAWALSGTRVLLHIQPAPLLTYEDLCVAAQKYASRRRWAVNDVWLARNASSLTFLIAAFSHLLSIAMGRDVMGNALVAFGLLLMACVRYVQSREPNVPDRDDPRGEILFYRDELSTLWSVPRTLWMAAGITILTVGYAMSSAGRWERIFGIGLLLLLPIFIEQFRRNQRRLAEVEALLSGSPFDSRL